MSNSVLSTETLDKTKVAELDQYIAGLPNKSEAIIHILHRGQEIFGYLPKELQLYIARKADLPAAKVNGIVSFYSFFSQEPSGKYQLSICLGTACFVKGADAVIKEFRKQLDMVDKRVSDDGRFSIRDIRCVGACGLAPVVMINEKIYGHVTVDDVADILDHYRGAEG